MPSLFDSVRETASPERLLLSGELLLLSFVIYLLGSAVYYRYFHPYKDVPGPFLASISTWWYWYSIRYAVGENTQWPIHERYGRFVRIAPNMVSICDPEAIDTIYGAKTTFKKTEFYEVFNPHLSKRPDSFCDRDDKHHASRRRITAPLYTQQNILSHEADFDRVIALLYRQMLRFTESKETFDMSVWLRRYTFDIIGELFYGKVGGFGFIYNDTDYNNWCLLMEHMPPVIAAMAYVPTGLKSLYMLSQMFDKASRTGLIGHFKVMQQAKDACQARVKEMQQPDWKPKHDNLQLLMDIVNEKGDEIDFHHEDIATELWAMVWAGSDTTAIALTAIFYHLHKNPKALATLRVELDDAFKSGALTYPVRFADASKLPYLRAVVHEALRIHVSIGTGMPRYVPAGGSTICGRYFHAGGEVIMNANAAHFYPPVFGDDAHEYVPERWLRDGEAGATYLERHMIHFGYGPRMCLGRNVTYTEMFKLLPTVLRDFEFELLSDWTLTKSWFHHQKNVKVKVSKRKENSIKDQNPVLKPLEGLKI